MDNLVYGSTDPSDADFDPALSEIARKYKGKPVSMQSALLQYSLRKSGYSPKPDPPKFMDNGLITFPDGRSIRLDGAAADVLECLVDLRATSKILIENKSGRPEAIKVLRLIRKNHSELAPHITLPGGKGRGGYSTTIVDGRIS